MKTRTTSNSITFEKQEESKKQALQGGMNEERKKRLVVIGHDEMNHVQLNNKLNALFHATDYTHDINAELAIIRQGWPTIALQMLFYNESVLPSSREGNDDYADRSAASSRLLWEKRITQNLNIHFLDRKDILPQKEHGEITTITQSYDEVTYLSSDDMYYYHTEASAEAIKRRREAMLRFLWSHPKRSREEPKKDVCSVVNHHFDVATDSSSYSVVHVRWMKNNGCLNRIGGLVHHLKNMTGMSMDRKAPCLLDPSYIESIVRNQCNMIEKPIYIITDGLNDTIIHNLQNDDRIGDQIRLPPPKNISWVGGDMMLGVLSDCFIGTPISTLSGNIARARTAIGKDPSTNFLFPMKRREKTDPWDFLCLDDANCLYDVRVLNHYVG